MEMSLIHLTDNNKDTEDESSEHSPYQPSPNIRGIFGEPEESPSIGDQYQAQLPQFIEPCDCLQLVGKLNNIDAEEILDSSKLGLHIPIMWSLVEAKDFKQAAVNFLSDQADTNSGENQTIPVNKSGTISVDVLFNGLDNKERIFGSSNLQLGDNKMDVDIALSEGMVAQLDNKQKISCPFPGSVGETWSRIEHDSFLLGLYIFGKNLLLVKKFVETKKMGDILSFYYGKFYKSNEYRRWIECRKMRSRKFIHGQRIFRGGKQQELLSRLVPHLSEEKQNKLLEVCRIFGEDIMSLEEYVFALKQLVGTDMLVEAVGIGKKHDLTGFAIEPIKPVRGTSLRPKIPTGKAWSSLSSGEVIKFLTGDFRLSKTRSNDLFWEAVWPRLLTRGWHLEQPKDHGISSLKHTLVFLTPGVKKFSRRKLKKGDHYFDSVSDVLNKVASDQSLLELETETAEGGNHEEDPKKGIDIKQCGLSNGTSRCYLQPRVRNSQQDQTKFMIVDTSLAHEGEGSKIRVMKRLPIDVTDSSSPSCATTESEHDDSSEESKDEAEETKFANLSVQVTAKSENSSSPEYLANGADLSLSQIDNDEVHITDVCNHKQQENTMKHQFRKKVKSNHSNYLPSVKRSMTASRHGESSHNADNMFSERKLSEENSLCMASQNTALHVDVSLNISSSSSSAKSSPEGRNESIQPENYGDDKICRQPLIDLNLIHISADLEANQLNVMGVMDNYDDSCAHGTSFLTETNQQQQPVELSDAGGRSFLTETNQQQQPVELSDAGGSTEQQRRHPSSNARRQSTRSRPLTTKALEALECGFFDTKKKRKHVEALPQYKLVSSSSRRVRQNAGVTSSVDDSFSNNRGDSRIEGEVLIGTVQSNTNMFESSRV